MYVVLGSALLNQHPLEPQTMLPFSTPASATVARQTDEHANLSLLLPTNATRYAPHLIRVQHRPTPYAPPPPFLRPRAPPPLAASAPAAHSVSRGWVRKNIRRWDR